MEIYSIKNVSGETMNEYDVNKKLEDLGIPDDVIQQGEIAIEDYAYENNINLDQLQPENKEKSKELKGTGDTVKQDYEAQLQTLGIPDSIITKGSAAITEYADANGISLPKAPTSGTNLNLKS